MRYGHGLRLAVGTLHEQELVAVGLLFDHRSASSLMLDVILRPWPDIWIGHAALVADRDLAVSPSRGLLSRESPNSLGEVAVLGIRRHGQRSGEVAPGFNRLRSTRQGTWAGLPIRTRRE